MEETPIAVPREWVKEVTGPGRYSILYGGGDKWRRGSAVFYAESQETALRVVRSKAGRHRWSCWWLMYEKEPGKFVKVVYGPNAV